MKTVSGLGVLAALALVASGCGGDSTGARDASVVTDTSALEDEGADASESDSTVAETPCGRACNTAASAGCLDNSTCDVDICSIREADPDCADEADAYFECVAMADATSDFTCDENDKPVYVGEGCVELLEAFVNCLPI